MFLSIVDQNTKRESGRKVQIGNIAAGKVGKHVFTWPSPWWNVPDRNNNFTMTFHNKNNC